MKIRQHIPNVVDDRGRKPLISEFNTIEELITISFVNNFMDDKFFKRFSFSPYINDHALLMVEYNPNDAGYPLFWVVGYIDATANELLNLPLWEAKHAGNS